MNKSAAARKYFTIFINRARLLIQAKTRDHDVINSHVI